MVRTLLPVLIACLVGAMTAAQPAINSLLRGVLGDPLLATIANFVVGLIALVGVFLWSTGGSVSFVPLSSHPWWYWIGGLFGASFVLCSLLLVPKVGAVMFFASVVAGQLFAAVLIDHFGLLGVPQHSASVLRILGVLMALGGMVLVKIS